MHVIDQLGRCLATSPQPGASGSTKRIVKIELLWITAYRLTRVTRLVVKGEVVTVYECGALGRNGDGA